MGGRFGGGGGGKPELANCLKKSELKFMGGGNGGNGRPEGGTWAFCS